MTTRDRVPLAHPVLLVVACPVLMVLPAAAVLWRGGHLLTALAAAVVVPLLLSTVGAVLLLALVRPGQVRSVSPYDAGDADGPAPQPARPVPVDLLEREVDLRESEHQLLRAASRTPVPQYDELLVLADRLRTARLGHAEAVLALGGEVEPELRDELGLRGRLPRSRQELTADKLGKGLDDAP